MKRLALGISIALAASQAYGQAAFPPPPPKVSPVIGVIDMHVHSHPDVFGRSMDDIDVATLAKARGLRGILLKNHISETASRAALVMRVVPGIEVFGGVVLNNAVGGINPDAVEWMHRIYGGRGRVVWLPTFESDKHVKTFSKPDAVGITVAPNGQVTPQMEAVLKIIARENLLLATGHVHPEEVLAVVKRGRELGVKNIIVTHGLTNVPGLTNGAGEGGRGTGGGDRDLLPAVPGRAERAARVPHALDADRRQARGAGDKGDRPPQPRPLLGPRAERQHDAPGRVGGGDSRDEARGHHRWRHRHDDAQEPGAPARIELGRPREHAPERFIGWREAANRAAAGAL